MAAEIHLIDGAPVREDIGPIFAFLPAPLRQRVERLAAHKAMADPRNARSARKKALKRAPDWARERAERGEPVHEFKLSVACQREYKALAADLAEVVAAAGTDTIAAPQLPAEACAFIADTSKMSFPDLATGAAKLAQRRRAAESEARLLAALLSGNPIRASGRRLWRPLLEPAALWAVGAALSNCLREGSCFVHGYQTRLEEQASCFYALCEDEKVLAVLEVRTRTGAVAQFRSKLNRDAGAYASDLALLMAARKFVVQCNWLGGVATLDADRFRACFVDEADHPKPS